MHESGEEKDAACRCHARTWSLTDRQDWVCSVHARPPETSKCIGRSPLESTRNAQHHQVAEGLCWAAATMSPQQAVSSAAVCSLLVQAELTALPCVSLQ